jgi:hypothetical protein
VLQGEGTKLRDIPNGTLPACLHQRPLLAVMMIRCPTRCPCAADALLLISTAVHFKLSKIPGREELMELLHDVLYRRKGQVEEQPGVPSGLPAFIRCCCIGVIET